MRERILVVEDDNNISDLLEIYLQNEGYEIITALTAEDVLENQMQVGIDLAIIDIMLPGENGFYLCKEIRKKYNYPIIMLTAKSDESSKITGLRMGADDYITTPFLPLEVVARVKAQIRRFKKYNLKEGKENQEDNILSFAGIKLNIKSRECFVNNKGCFEGTVKSRLYHARQQLKAKLEVEFDEI